MVGCGDHQPSTINHHGRSVGAERRKMGILGILAALALAGLVATFALLNQTPTPLNFGLYSLPQARLHEVALAAAAAGALCSAFLALGSLLKASRTVRALRRQ